MDSSDANGMSLMRRVNLIFRFSYTLPFVLASVCGVVCAVPYGAPWYVMVLVPVAVLFLALFVNFSNDYFDHMSGIDRKVTDDRMAAKREVLSSEAMEKLYWEGNQFDTGLVSERQGRAIMAALVLIVLVLAVPVILYSGWPVIVLGLIGLMLAYFYTAPPVNLGARGLGEVAVAVSFLMMCLCSFYVVSGTVEPAVALFSVVVGILVGLMRLIDSMSANKAHLEMGEINLSLRLGEARTVTLIRSAVIVAYVLVLLTCCFDLLYLALFLTVPLARGIFRTIRDAGEHWSMRLVPYSFGLAVTTEILFIVASAVSLLVGPITLW